MIKPIRVLFLLLLFGFIIFLYLGLPLILAGVLKNTFQEGTGCEVHLEDPEVYYLSTQAAVHNVSIICEGEEGEEGFYAKKVLAGIDLLQLFRKKALVSPLKISGARVSSLSWDSAFIKTLTFVLKKPEHQKSSWKAWVPEVEIDTDVAAHNVFEFGTKQASVIADTVRFVSRDAVDRKETAVILEASAQNVRLQISKKEVMPLGNLELLAQVKDGKISFVRTEVPDSLHGIFHTVTGHIVTKEDVFNLDVYTQFHADVPKSVRVYDREYRYQGHGEMKTQVRGAFTNPEVTFELLDSKINSYGFEDFNDTPCAPVALKAHVHYSSGSFDFRTLEVQDVFVASGASVRFKEGIAFSHAQPLRIFPQGLMKLFCFGEEELKNSKSHGAAPFTVSFNSDSHDKLSGNFELKNLILEEIFPLTNILKKGNHQGTISLILDGTFDNPTVRGVVKVESKNLGASMNTEVAITYSDSHLKAQGSIFNSENTILLEINNNEVPHAIKADFKKFPLSVFIKNELDSLWYAKMSTQLTAKEDFSNTLEGNISFKEVEFGPAYTMFYPQRPIEIKVDKGALILPSQRFDIQGLDVDVEGRLSKDAGISLRTKIGGDIPLILARLTQTESLTGKVNADIKVDGSLSAPKIFGELTVNDAALIFKAGSRVSSIEKITSRITFDDRTIDIRKLEGTFGEGVLRVGGKIESFLDPAVRAGQVILVGDNLLLDPVSGLSMYVDLNLSLLFFSQTIPVIKGDIVLHEATYQKNFSIQSIVESMRAFILGSKSKVELSTKKDVFPVMLNIHARSSQGLLVDTSVLQAELDGDLKISGFMHEPKIEGEVSIVDGSFKINQTNFFVLAGAMKFDGTSQINPYVQLSSEGDLRKRSGETEKIFLSISGPLNATKVSFASDGATRPHDIVKQLGLGTGGSELSIIDTNRKNVAFREVLSPSSDLSLSERFAGLTGFDQVRIETGVSVRTGDFVPQVLASRPLPYELRATLWTELAGDRASGARMEKRIQDNYSVFTGWRNQSVIDASSSTGGSNLSVGFRFRESFKGFSFFEERIKEVE